MAVDVLERITTYTALGLRFWDPVLDVQIREGLSVTARPALQTRRSVRQAYRSLSGIYSFQGLPGMRAVETGRVAPDGSPAPAERFVVEVSDTRRRFAEVAFEVTLPLSYRGLFLTGDPAGSPPTAPPGVLLYSAATRRRPSWIGAVRGELLETATGQPAAHALAAVTDPMGAVWHGIADEAGRFTVWLPYPAIEATPESSPPVAPGLPLLERSWPMRLQIFYSPATRWSLPGTTVPDYESILTQDAAVVWTAPPEDGGAPVPEWLGDLPFGQEAAARSGGAGELLVGPETTSP